MDISEVIKNLVPRETGGLAAAKDSGAIPRPGDLLSGDQLSDQTAIRHRLAGDGNAPVKTAANDEGMQTGLRKEGTDQSAITPEADSLRQRELQRQIADRLGVNEGQQEGAAVEQDAGAREQNGESSATEVSTINQHLEGQRHPETGVRFERFRITLPDGTVVEGVFPVFDSVYDAQLPADMYESSDYAQFKECNRQLADTVDEDPELRSRFTDEQLEQIRNGDTPDGYTWHHNQETGKMQLVRTDVHSRTSHTGGRAIWGGGSEARFAAVKGLLQ